MIIRRVLVNALILAAAAPAVPLKASDIAGRWQGKFYARDSSGVLTLDIVSCGDSWCGIRVAANDTCAGTALKVNSGTVAENGARFEGTLALAPGTQPYNVHATIFPPEEAKPLAMQIIGDTGGDFGAYRRSFPFETAIFRIRDAVCRTPQTVSALH